MDSDLFSYFLFHSCSLVFVQIDTNSILIQTIERMFDHSGCYAYGNPFNVLMNQWGKLERERKRER